MSALDCICVICDKMIPRKMVFWFHPLNEKTGKEVKSRKKIHPMIVSVFETRENERVFSKRLRNKIN